MLNTVVRVNLLCGFSFFLSFFLFFFFFASYHLPGDSSSSEESSEEEDVRPARPPVKRGKDTDERVNKKDETNDMDLKVR